MNIVWILVEIIAERSLIEKISNKVVCVTSLQLDTYIDMHLENDPE
jgi:hypothetical protein